MTITRANLLPPKTEAFIAGAPDAGAQPMGSPPASLKTKRGTHRSQVSVVLPDQLLAKLDIVATRRYMSRSAVITMLVSQFLESEQ